MNEGKKVKLEMFFSLVRPKTLLILILHNWVSFNGFSVKYFVLKIFLLSKNTLVIYIKLKIFIIQSLKTIK